MNSSINHRTGPTPPTPVPVTAATLARSPIVAVSAGVDALAALRVMRDRGVRHLVVLDGTRCVGVVTETALLYGVTATVRAPIPAVGRICGTPAPTVPATASVPEVARAVVDSGVDAVVVTRDHAPVGLITAADLVRVLMSGH